jgi:serine/threonine protein phosphatase PrpC
VFLKPFVTPEPDVCTLSLCQDRDMFVVLASDGLFDVMSSKDVAKFITR